MTTTRMGWGSPYFVGGIAATTPFLASNAGMLANVWGESVQFGPDLTFGTAPANADVTITYTPVGGGAPVVSYLTASGGMGQLDFYSGWPPEVNAGVYELSFVLDGVPAENTLVLAVAIGIGSTYGNLSWYSEAAAPPFTEFWTRFVGTQETPT